MEDIRRLTHYGYTHFNILLGSKTTDLYDLLEKSEDIWEILQEKGAEEFDMRTGVRFKASKISVKHAFHLIDAVYNNLGRMYTGEKMEPLSQKPVNVYQYKNNLMIFYDKYTDEDLKFLEIENENELLYGDD